MDYEQISLFPKLSLPTMNGHHVAITGVLPFPRSDVVSAILACGGFYDSAVKLVTDYLVLGDIRPSSAVPNGVTRKLRKAKILQQNGGKIKIISFDELESLGRNSIE